MDYQDLKQMMAGYANRELTQRSNWYGDVANAYDRARLKYPTALIQQVVEIAQLSASSHILEVGCGPATATVSFAALDCPIVCLEPNAAFTHLARQNCESYANVTIHNTSFEEWPLVEGRFDAVLAATSFHWIPADVAYAKAAQALTTKGRLILLWNKQLQPSYEVYQRLAEVYQRHTPSLNRYEDYPTQEKILQNLGHMAVESSHFRDMVSGQTISKVTYTTLEYLTLLTTYSPYLELKEQTRKDLFDGLQMLIEQEFSGKLHLTYMSAFHIAQKA